jgi:glycosyltransferase involved in cell wall biosynthesis
VLPRVIPPASAFTVAPQSRARIVGLLSSASGIGKSARLCVDTLQKAGCPVSTENVAGLFASDDGIAYPASARRKFASGGFSIYHLNPSMLLPGIIRSGLGRYYRSYNIGYWAWELESLPPEWIESLRFMHAIMVPSRYCQAAIERYTSKPVLVVPHPIAAERDSAPAAIHHGGVFRVVNVFRFGSSFERKNPLALVDAFRLAFGGDPTVELVLKTSDGVRFPVEMARLIKAIGGQQNVQLVDEVWADDRVTALMRSADVYASLHRSEGFGLPLAEAMMAAIPVIATNWSGNTDFCTPDSSFPVDYSLIPFRDTHGDYEQVRDARWAEPSVQHAARQLRCVRDDLPAARAKARIARSALCRHIEAHSYRSALASIADQTMVFRPTAVPASAPGGRR